MGKIISQKFQGMNLWAKFSLITTLTLLASVFMYEGWYKSHLVNAASTVRTYYVVPDTTTDVGADGVVSIASGSPSSDTAIPGMTTLNTAEGSSSSRYYGTPVPAQGVATVLMKLYGPEYTANAVDVSSISASFALRQYNTAGSDWQLILYDYDPAGAAGNKTLVATSDPVTVTSTSTSQVQFTAWTISGTGRVAQNHRLLTELVYTRGGSTTSTQRVYFDNATNSCNITFTETDIATDTTAPTITAFTVPITSSSLTISGITLTASDAVGVTGYLINESATPPAAGSITLGTAPTSYTAGSAGIKTLYAWARDTAGNVSAVYTGRTCTITLPDTTKPTVTTFTVPATSSSLTISGITFTASDDTGVTGYLINESATPPAAASITLGTAPTTYTAGSAGANTLYAWVKDATGNVSNVFTGRTCTITLADTTKPTLDAFTMPATASSTTVNVTTFTASDAVGVTGYKITESAIAPVAADAGWTGTAPLNFTFAGNGARTAYAWAKDAAGNVSTSRSANVTITLPINSTATETATAAAGSSTSIIVTAPYSNDDNSNNSCTVEHKLSTDSIWTVSNLSHTESPYSKTIAGLSTISTYNIRVTYNDPDGVTGSQIQLFNVTTPKISSPLMHNSVNLDPTNVKGYGAWGVAQDCAWCHSKDTGNIKRVKNSIQTATGMRTVVFNQLTAAQLTTAGTFGNDQRANLNGSQNVCEACHHQTKFHQYSSSKPQVVSLTHYNNKDCTQQCHTHGNGFKFSGAGGCAACHGNPPVITAQLTTNAITFSGQPGAHDKHVNLKGMTCIGCHSNSNGAGAMSAGDNKLQIGFNFNSGTVPGFRGAVSNGTFTGNSNFPSWEAAPGTTLALAANSVTCSVYCHGSWTGSGGQINTPSWVGASQTGSCNACHGDATTPPSSGSHSKHAATQAISCVNCHGPSPTNADHINGLVAWQMPGSGTYKGYNSYSSLSQPLGGSFGSCATIYCHSNVQGSGGNGAQTSYNTPTWGNPATVSGCGACHNDMLTSGSSNHIKHTAKYACSICHNASGSGTTKHGDSYIDVNFSGLGTGTTYTQARTLAGSDGYGSCSTSSCHFNNNAQWGTTLTCIGCHPLAALQANGAHGKHLSTAPSFYTYTGNRSTSGFYDFGCSTCHSLDQAKHANGAVDVTINKFNTGSGGAVGYLRSMNSATVDGLTSSNGPSGIFGITKVSVKCSAAYCHSNGFGANLKYLVSPDWYGPAYAGDKCAMCHGNSPNANDPVNQPGSPAHYSKNFLGFSNVSGGHLVGIHSNSIFTGSVGLAPAGNTTKSSHGNGGTSTTINCNMCHYSTVTSAANDNNRACVTCHTTIPKNPAELIADKRFHINGSVDVAFSPIAMKSKAQLREASYDKGIWTRQGGYKQAGSYDASFKTFSTATQWNASTKTCSNISCHNGSSVKWGDTGGVTTCSSCHDKL